MDPLGLKIVGNWERPPTPTNINIETKELRIDLFALVVASVDFSAMADIRFIIGCSDTCTGETWKLDSGERTISYDGTIDIPAPKHLPCFGLKGRALTMCRMINLRKYQQWSEKAARLADSKVVKLVINHFDEAVSAIEAAVDPTLWCKTLPRP